MKRIGIAIAVTFMALVLFIIGLVPAERILTADKPDSYVLIGIARYATWVAGACEFILGALFAAGVCAALRRRRNRRSRTEQVSFVSAAR